MTLKPGDVVELKSGSPPMTVAVVENVNSVLCCWMDGAILNKISVSGLCLRRVPKMKQVR